MSSDWTTRFEPDRHTVALYRFDEGDGREAHDACGDAGLTLKARHALWGRAPDGGAAARFESVDDDANVFVGPLNHPKLMLKPCTREWTVEAWIRYTGPWGGFGRYNATYAHLCGSSEEGYHLSHIGVRAGFQFLLEGGNAPDAGHGLLPTSRYEGNFAGKDPNYDVHYMADLEPALAAKDADGLRDDRWHHVAWQFRFRDQMHVLFVDGTPVRRIQPYRKIFNDTDEHVGVPFMVGGILCWSDPPWPGRGNFVGEMYDLRISDVMRYPVADRLSIVGGPGFSPCDVYDDESLRAGFRFGTEALPFAVPSVPYRVQLAADGADGSVRWELSDGRLPNGLELRKDGIVEGTVRGYVDRDAHFTVNATDQGGRCDSHTFAIGIRTGTITTAALPPAFVGTEYRCLLGSRYTVKPVTWKVTSGRPPDGIVLEEASGELKGVPVDRGIGEFRVAAADSAGAGATRVLGMRVLPRELHRIEADEDTVFLYGWQDEDLLYARDALGDEELTLTCVGRHSDRRVAWPGREGRFPQDTGHGEHGWVSLKTDDDKHNLRTCREKWTVEAWIRPGGPVQGFGASRPFDFGHVCGTYDTSESGVWELYISNLDSPDGSWAPGVHFACGPDRVLKDLHPWKRPAGVVGNHEDAGIRDDQWHHVAWQYGCSEDLHQLFLDGALIWQMRAPGGIRLVNERRHQAQFSVGTRIDRYAYWCADADGRHHHPNYLGWGNFFGQIGEIRVSSIRRY